MLQGALVGRRPGLEEFGDALDNPRFTVFGSSRSVGRADVVGARLVEVQHDVLVRDPLQALLATNALERELLLVEGVDFCQLEPGAFRGIQDGLPDAVVGVVEDDAGPSARFQHAVHLAKGVRHQPSVVWQRVSVLVLDVNHSFLALVREALIQPGLPDQIAVSVEDVGAERRVRENIVDRFGKESTAYWLQNQPYRWPESDAA